MSWEIIVFIVLFIVIAVGVFVFGKKTGAAKDQYDERQEQIRKNAYKYSAMTMLLCSLLYYIVVSVLEQSFMEDGIAPLLIALIGIAVFAIYAIFKDAFFGVKGKQVGMGKPHIYMILISVIVIANGVGAVGQIKSGELIKDGLLTANVMSLALTVLFLLILISFGIKYVLNQREERRDDE